MYLGKIAIGFVAFTSILVSVFFMIGFLINDLQTSMGVFKNYRVFFVIQILITVLSSIPAWRWRKEIWKDVVSIFLW
jgi:uncharacterized membrane protein